MSIIKLLTVRNKDSGKTKMADNVLPVKSWCQELQIRQHFASIAHPQTNGQVNSPIATLKHDLRNGWSEQEQSGSNNFPIFSEPCRTTPSTSTKETPFALTYGAEAVIPAEIGIPSSRTENFDPEQNNLNLAINLDELEERRDQAVIRMARYKNLISQYFNAKVRHQYFTVGDLVLRRNDVSHAQPARKLDPNWEGPYRVIRAFSTCAYKLETLQGRTLSNT